MQLGCLRTKYIIALKENLDESVFPAFPILS